MDRSRNYRQYSSNAANWVARPSELRNTDLTNAFEPDLGNATPNPTSEPTRTGNLDRDGWSVTVPWQGFEVRIQTNPLKKSPYNPGVDDYRPVKSVVNFEVLQASNSRVLK